MLMTWSNEVFITEVDKTLHLEGMRLRNWKFNSSRAFFRDVFAQNKRLNIGSSMTIFIKYWHNYISIQCQIKKLTKVYFQNARTNWVFIWTALIWICYDLLSAMFLYFFAIIILRIALLSDYPTSMLYWTVLRHCIRHLNNTSNAGRDIRSAINLTDTNG